MKKQLLFLATVALLLNACNYSTVDPIPESVNSEERVQISEKYLSPSEAGELARMFMESLEDSVSDTRSSSHRHIASVELLGSSAVSRSEEQDTVFYVVDFEEGGFTLVAAERDLCNNVYVYSTTGEFEVEDNPVMEIYLENAIATMPDAPRRSDILKSEAQTRALVIPNPDAPIQGEEDINGVPCKYVYKNSHSVKQPLLSTLWHQEDPYNIKCPPIGDEYAAVGCVAVAIGQICAYYKRPAAIDGNSIDWDTILTLKRHYYEFSIGLNEVADLLHTIGVMADTNYGLEDSGSNIDKAIIAFKKLGYSTVKKTKYSPNECVTSVANNNPVFIKGYSKSGDGHAWVVDGYDRMERWIEYYRVDNGELYASYGCGGYIYLHFNAGQYSMKLNAYYLCSGTRGENKDYSDLSDYTYTENYQLITGIK